MILYSLIIVYCRSSVAAVETNVGFGRDLEHTFATATLKDDFLSPFTTNAKYAVIAGSAATATAVLLRGIVEEPIDDYLYANKPLGNSGIGDKIGMVVPNIAYYLGQSGAYLFFRDAKYSRRANLMLRSTIHSSLMSTLIKVTTREGRPYNENEKTSFPSGHTATTFAFAATVAMDHDWYWGLSAYTLATYVGLSRLNDHQHFLHDVLAGATIGISYGIGVFNRVEAETFHPIVASSELVYSILPTDDLRGASLVLAREF